MLIMRDETVRLGFYIAASAILHYAVLAQDMRGFSGAGNRLPAKQPLGVLKATLVKPTEETPEPARDGLQGDKQLPGRSPQPPSLSQQETPHDDPLTQAGMRLSIIDDYLPAHLLTERPYPIDSIDPTPKDVNIASLVGTASLLLLVSSEGKIDSILVQESSLPPAMVNHAIAAFEAARFQPGKINNQAVRSRMIVLLNTAPPEINPDAGNPQSAKFLRESQLKARGEGK